jgi:hypothetical protein
LLRWVVTASPLFFLGVLMIEPKVGGSAIDHIAPTKQIAVTI